MDIEKIKQLQSIHSSATHLLREAAEHCKQIDFAAAWREYMDFTREVVSHITGVPAWNYASSTRSPDLRSLADFCSAPTAEPPITSAVPLVDSPSHADSFDPLHVGDPLTDMSQPAMDVVLTEPCSKFARGPEPTRIHRGVDVNGDDVTADDRPF